RGIGIDLAQHGPPGREGHAAAVFSPSPTEKCRRWVNRVVPTANQLLPVYPEQQTFSSFIGISKGGQTVIRRANQFYRFHGVHVARSASNSVKTRAREGEFREPIQSG